MNAAKRTAIVTGAGSGIGAAVTAELLGSGWRVALAGRRERPLHETVAASAAGADEALVLPTDVTDPDAVRALFAGVTDSWG
ncbi:MAG: SDR family oxidoreductase, partial [Gaiellaceae bacterium]